MKLHFYVDFFIGRAAGLSRIGARNVGLSDGDATRLGAVSLLLLRVLRRFCEGSLTCRAWIIDELSWLVFGVTLAR